MHNSYTISKKIIKWYDLNKRNLPWRSTKSKKQIHYYRLISEFMLQQTQVKTVIPYFQKFIKKFPSNNELSTAKEVDILKEWEGLGYYRRAKNLLKTSKIISKNYRNLLPESFVELNKFPGIGEYTANALRAIVFNKNEIPVDGNIRRFLVRFFNLNINSKKFKKDIIEKKKIIKTNSRFGDYVEALMELGALICKPQQPDCKICPVSSKCLSFKEKSYKKIFSKKIIKKLQLLVLCAINKKKFLMTYKNKYKFLNNYITFPMENSNQLNKIKKKFNGTKVLKEKFNYRISNKLLILRLVILRRKILKKDCFWIKMSDLKKYPVASLTKKILYKVNYLV